MGLVRFPRAVLVTSLLVLLVIGLGLALGVLMHLQDRRADEMVQRIKHDLVTRHDEYAGAVDWMRRNADPNEEFVELKLPREYAPMSETGWASYSRRGTRDAPAYAVSFIAKFTDGALYLVYTTEPSPQRERWFKSWATWTEEMAPGWYLVSEQ